MYVSCFVGPPGQALKPPGFRPQVNNGPNRNLTQPSPAFPKPASAPVLNDTSRNINKGALPPPPNTTDRPLPPQPVAKPNFHLNRPSSGTAPPPPPPSTNKPSLGGPPPPPPAGNKPNTGPPPPPPSLANKPRVNSASNLRSTHMDNRPLPTPPGQPQAAPANVTRRTNGAPPPPPSRDTPPPPPPGRDTPPPPPPSSNKPAGNRPPPPPGRGVSAGKGRAGGQPPPPPPPRYVQN